MDSSTASVKWGTRKSRFVYKSVPRSKIRLWETTTSEEMRFFIIEKLYSTRFTLKTVYIMFECYLGYKGNVI